MSRTARRLGASLRRLPRRLGRVVYRGVGVVVALMALGAGRALMAAAARGHGGVAAGLATVASALGAVAVVCVGRGRRRLSDAEP